MITASPEKLHPPRESGAVLFVALIFLLILTLLGVMLARMQTTEERMAQNDGNHELAVEAAEASLRFAESNIAEGNYTAFSQNANGLYTLNPAVGSVYTPGSDSFWATAGNAITYTGAAMTSVTQAPQFIVESVPGAALPGSSISIGGCTGYNTNGCISIFQITAHATGGDQTGTATLRSIYQQE